jgi:enoyl-CoA hydratase/carnithine racemase
VIALPWVTARTMASVSLTTGPKRTVVPSGRGLTVRWFHHDRGTSGGMSTTVRSARLAYACDLRIAGTDAVFGNPEPGLGILAAAGACWRLRELVDESVAKQVLLAGRTLDAPAALACGLVMDVVATDRLLAEAHALLDRMARSSALALRLTKLVTDASGAHPVADDLAQAVLFESPDKQQRMTRFLEKKGGRA